MFPRTNEESLAWLEQELERATDPKRIEFLTAAVESARQKIKRS